MERWNKTTGHNPAKQSARGRGARPGKVTLVTLIAILGMVVLIGFVGNAGHVVTAKVNTQNAADAIAFSSAQWMARGMNAVTATNHLLGEVTGLVVVIEGLGGPEADAQMEDYPPNSEIADNINRALARIAPMKGGYGASAFTSADTQFIDFIVKRVSPQDRNLAKHKAFATVFDSKLMLKRDLRERLIVKSVANFGFMVPPYWGFLSALAAYIAHAASDAQMVKIGIEWVVLEGLEKVVTSSPVRTLKVKVMEEQLIPALAAHGDFIAGRMDKKNAKTKRKPKAGVGIVNGAVSDALEHLGDVYEVDAAVFPAAASLRLPIVAEPAPSGQRTVKNEPAWGTDEALPVANSEDLSDIQEKVDESKSQIRKRLQELNDGLKMLEGLKTNIDQQLGKGNELGTDEQQAFTDELKEVTRAIKEKKERIAKLEREMAELTKNEAEVKKVMDKLQKMPPGSGNLSAHEQHLPLNKMNQAEERYTQWVRASYPYVDAFRATIIKQFETYLGRSKAASHYEKWTNRYTLIKAWKFRSGYRFHAKQRSNEPGQWRLDPNTKQLEMYVMVDAFKAGPRRDQKGHEIWTQNSTKGKEKAEELFTVIGLTHRDLEPLFSPVIYPVALDGGVTTIAQAIYYNSNEQTPAARNAQPPSQAKIGWDTLNWDPSTPAPEWGTKTSSAKARWPWEIFDSKKSVIGSAKVKLNWQAKLMPVTQRRFKQACKPSVSNVMNREMYENMVKTLLFFDPLVTH